MLLLAGMLSLAPVLVGAVEISVDLNSVSHPDARRLLGMSFDARTSFQVGGAPIGYFDPITAQPLATGLHWLQRAPRTSLRYPQGPVNVWNWKSSVGAPASRPLQPTLGQAAVFGLDEMMAVVAQSSGMGNDDLNMMVNIYQPGLVVGGSAITDAVDLVAYMNLPEASGNTWAIQRAANGHAAAYGVSRYNLGNEPWSFTEYDYRTSGALDPAQDGALRYAQDMQPFVDALLAADSELKLTLPIPSPAINAQQQAAGFTWQRTQLDTFVQQIHGLVANIYYDGRAPAGRGVGFMESFLDQSGALLATHNAEHGTDVRLIIGEHAHAIDLDHSTNPPTIITPDFAMQWHGAVDTADFLAMLSQKSFVERAHFFIYGNTAATWHPYRSDGTNVDGSQRFTVMPAAALYELLRPVLHGRALQVAVASHAPSDGESYALRAAAFVDPGATRLTLLLVNRDPQGAQTAQLAELSGWLPASATLLTGGSADAETINAQSLDATPPPEGLQLPPLSILILTLNRNGSAFLDGFEAL